MISSKNRIISVKVNKNIHEFLKIYSKKFNVSISKICEHLLSVAILEIDKEQQKDNLFYAKLSEAMREYDLRRK